MIRYPNVKINLGLSVLKKREDGFHDIETLFVPYFGIHDTLEIIPGDSFSETSAALFAKYGPIPETVPEGYSPNLCQAISENGKVMITIAKSDGVGWNPLKDLTVKAYSILDEEFNLPPVKIYLEKTSPVGAGLGGGSSDAAFALRMISEMFSLGLDENELAKRAATLGSDCPVFIYNRPMIGKGRGEILSAYDLDSIDYGQGGSAEYELTVLTPEGIAVSTADAYRGITPRERMENPPMPLMEALGKGVGQWKDCLVNDFETTVFDKYPGIRSIKESLYESGAVYASMSGSGSSVFAIYRK